MEVTCPNCKEIITVGGLGRKRLAIHFNIVSKALQPNKKGVPHLINTAIEIEKLTGIKVTPGFVSHRLREEAKNKGTDFDAFINRLMTTVKKRRKLPNV